MTFAKSFANCGVLLNPAKKFELVIHFTDWLNVADDSGTDTLPLIQKIKNIKISCIYAAEEEKESVCPDLISNKQILVKKLPGTHHFNGDYKLLYKTIRRLHPS